MDKVNELLRQAWKEALIQGVMITDVEFQVTENMAGQFNLIRPRIDSQLVEKERQK